ncbi:NAD(P)H dehydrogenase (quinone) [Nocardia tenerifensis]|uniref:NAD(P)H dehydrogenase (Quinone) n=1 Tax=Nocardia tenerifensis TaxID=228006 RepID=A0A318KIC2_9NOCA|nr:NAD(P)H-dependent oxidoreductase [Nocardia tenerifensis]PXX60417.1 NAD(P)H dehydrogenase (quinone) [Nocardia tenerifensis]
MTNERSRPNVLLVVSHPDHESATWAVARAVEQGIRADGGTVATTHDLTASGFDPVFTAADLAVHRLLGEVPDDVRREQQLIEAADVVALLFPVYWWSLPALAKGWIDRVFSRGWAYENSSPEGPSAVRELHFIALAGVNQASFDRRGYKDSLTLQLKTGIGDYSEIAESAVEILYGTETTDAGVHAELAAQGYKVGADLAQRAQAVFDRQTAGS